MAAGEEPARAGDGMPKADGACGAEAGCDAVVDVSQESLEISMFQRPLLEGSAEGLYVYRNTLHLVPRAIEQLGRLKKLKFFTNEIEVLPPEVGDLGDLETLQVEIPLPGLSSLPFHKLKCLKEVEISRVPTRLSALSFLSEISALKNLTKLSICHFSIRYLPAEIGCLKKLEELDLSFNKLKNLPSDITELSALKTLRVANNKLVDLPEGITSLRRLEFLDLSNNRLTSLTSLDLASMQALQYLNLQYNNIPHCCQVPSWVCCNFEGNGEDSANNKTAKSIVEVEIHDVAIRRGHCNLCNGSHGMFPSLYPEATSSSRQWMRKGWKRRDQLQHMARQERLNLSRKCKGKDINDNVTVKAIEENNSCVTSVAENVSESDDDTKLSDSSLTSSFPLENISGAGEGDRCPCAADGTNCTDNEKIGLSRRGHENDYSCSISDSTSLNKDNELVFETENNDSPLGTTSESTRSDEHNEFDNDREENVSPSCSDELSKNCSGKSKRHSDENLLNPKPTKFRRPVNECSDLSCKYSIESFCSIDDHLPDGFYDAGRNRPFMSLEDYEQGLHLDSREVILLDRDRDEELDAIISSARLLLSRWKRSCSAEKEEDQVDNLHRASMLALFVSDCFGGSDRSASVMRARRAAFVSNKQQPFVCTCSDGNIYDTHGVAGGLSFSDLCEKSIRLIKESRNSNVVPIGTLRFGVCRHRAVLMKYLCDRANPPIPCELVRGYLDFMPHAWNAIHVKRGNIWVRMLVDACHPTDIREETDPEYFCRYIPLTRGHVPLTPENSSISGCVLPSSLVCHGTEETTSCSVTHCKYGTLDAAVKVRSFEAYGASNEQLRNFECSFLGEVRMLGALREHKCIVEIYGHQLSCSWVPPEDGNKECRLLQSIIIMEYVRGGSLKCYLEKLLEGGEKHVPVDMALCIARDVACALVEVHSKHIIHRDIKSDNILIDLDSKRSDGTPVVKLSDFDRSVPLHSSKHTCCIAHLGIHPPEFCVGTPRFMAPEVVQAMHQRNVYGLEVDIWSYGCLLLELLTLQTPYSEHSDAELYELLQKKHRPRLTPDLEALVLPDEPGTGSESGSSSDSEAEILKLLVDLFYQCTRGDPADRPTARHIYDKLCAVGTAPGLQLSVADVSD